MVVQTGLSAREVLQEVFRALTLGAPAIRLDPSIAVLIADDSDWHRTKQGFTSYREVHIVELGSRKFLLAFGEACGDYPAEPFNCDIFVWRLEEGAATELSQKVLREALKENQFFQSSLIMAYRDGNIGLPEMTFNRTVRSMATMLEGKNLSRFVARQVKTSPEFLSVESQGAVATAKPLVTGNVLYGREAVPFLVEKARLAMLA